MVSYTANVNCLPAAVGEEKVEIGHVQDLRVAQECIHLQLMSKEWNYYKHYPHVQKGLELCKIKYTSTAHTVHSTHLFHTKYELLRLRR